MARESEATQSRGRNARASRNRGDDRRAKARKAAAEARRRSRRQGMRIWQVNVLPLVAAARAGTSEATRTARRERARARRAPWWRRPWVLATAGGLVVAGAAAGTYAVMARRNGAGEQTAGAGGPAGTGAGAEQSGIRSTVAAGRERVAEATRTVLHKLRRGEPAGAGSHSQPGGESASPAGNGAAPSPDGQGMPADAPMVGSGYLRESQPG